MTKTPLGLQKKKKVTNLIQEKNNVYESYQISKNNNRILGKLKFLQEDLHNEIEVSKLIYFFRITYKVIHIQEKSKVYWLLLESFLNNKKIPLITLLFHGNEYVPDFIKKTELFNLFFARQFSLISIELPVCLHYTIGKHLHTLNFPNKDSCNNSIVLQTPYQKQLGLFLDARLTF